MAPHRRALVVLTAARTSPGIQFQAIASAPPQLVEALGLSCTDLGSLIGLHFAPGIAMALPGSVLGRRFGDMRVDVAGLVLMRCGGTLTCLAQGFAGLAAGRVLSGAGGALLNVATAKLVTDRFAGRHEMVLAMAIFMDAFPIGIGLATLGPGPLAARAGWQLARAASTGFVLAALLLMRLGHARHPHDGAAVRAAGPIAAPGLGLVSLAGAIWGLCNGAYAVMSGFSPTFLAHEGLTPAGSGAVAGTAVFLSPCRASCWRRLGSAGRCCSRWAR